ncbi:BTB/POZ domain protein [Parasponia andersonii]|uniref:BTB/POZ domain protein n=1 Tax=Parasponia andersonii TaxID=3476 RepID=A0A2P5D4K7_PARAD|nr:BTB/POZ domain protein [Parasponia andersonii]
MSSELSLVKYGHRTGLSPLSSSSSFLNSVFISTVNAAAKTLVSVTKSGVRNEVGKWTPRDHFRFMMMIMTWLTLWVLRVLMDNIPSCSLALMGYSSPFNLLKAFSPFGLIDFPRSRSLASASASASLSVSSLQKILNDGVEAVPVQALGRALSQILALLNEIPATSRKYQFSMAMAERIMDGNARSGHVDMLQVNRVALSSAFDRTSALLHRSLEKRHRDNSDEYSGSGAWAARAIRALPLGSYVAPYIKGLSVCVGAVRSWVEVIVTHRSRGTRRIPGFGGGEGGRLVWEEEEGGEVVAEKLGEELMWISHKLKAYGAVDEALVQWSFASGLASVSLTTDPRLQGLIVKISAMLFSELNQEDVEVSTEVKFRLLLLWLPLFCHAGNGFAYPVLTYFEKADVERAIDQAIWSLPPMDQEVILTNWIQDFAISASDWPNLQSSYDRWCQSTRNLVV